MINTEIIKSNSDIINAHMGIVIFENIFNKKGGSGYVIF